MGCLVALGVVIVLMLWPYSQYRFRFDLEELLKQYVDSERPATLSQMHCELAVQIERDRQGNWRIMQRWRRSLQLALILFLLEILSWLMSLAGYEACRPDALRYQSAKQLRPDRNDQRYQPPERQSHDCAGCYSAPKHLLFAGRHVNLPKAWGNRTAS